MSVDAERARIVASLKAGLDAGQLSPAASRQGHQILDRLQSRVRVVLCGPSGVGKTHLRHVLLGRVLEAGPNVQVSQNAATRPIAPHFGVIACDADVLADIDLIDLVWSAESSEAIATTLTEADVVLWCTQDFAEPEARLWAQAPDHLKDHSFLVLTQADVLAAQGNLQSRIAKLGHLARDEFQDFYPITTAAAMAELESRGILSAETVLASGAKALSDAVTKVAADGRQADLDAGLLFLSRHRLDMQHSSTAPDTKSPKLSGPTTYAKALALLRARMADIDAPDIKAPDAGIGAVLARCADVAENLIDLTAQGTPTQDPDYVAWCDDMQMAADKITLMALEHSMGAAADAVSILAQLSRELESREFH